MKTTALLLACLITPPFCAAFAEDNSFNFLVAVKSSGTNAVYTFTHGVKVEQLTLPDIEAILREDERLNPVMTNVHTVYIEPKEAIAPETLYNVFMTVKRAGWPAALLLHIEESNDMRASVKLAIPFEMDRSQTYYFPWYPMGSYHHEDPVPKAVNPPSGPPPPP